MHTVFLALGSNIGDRKRNIDQALKALKEEGVAIEKVSTILETTPEGGPPQNNYLNAVIKGHTSFTPEELLGIIKKIEQEMGRKKTVVNGPRIIDIDLLLYDKLKLKKEDLIIPHPRMWQRQFVLAPLKEIESNIDYLRPS